MLGFSFPSFCCSSPTPPQTQKLISPRPPIRDGPDGHLADDLPEAGLAPNTSSVFAAPEHLNEQQEQVRGEEELQEHQADWAQVEVATTAGEEVGRKSECSLMSVLIQRFSVSQALGWHLDVTNGAPAMICDVLAGGAIALHNSIAEPEQQIQSGFYLTAVNCVWGTADRLIQELQQARDVEIEVRKPTVWTTIIERRAASEALGLEVKYSEQGRSLVVTCILGGATERYNQLHPESAIKAQDRILSVSGARGDAAILVQLLARDPAVLIVSRCIGAAPCC